MEYDKNSEKVVADRSSNKTTDWVSITISLCAVLVAAGSFILSYQQNIDLSQSTGAQLKEINDKRDSILEEQGNKISALQEERNSIISNIDLLTRRQAYSSEKANNLSSNFNNLYSEVEKIKRKVVESRTVIDYMSASSFALRCDVPRDEASQILSFGGTQLFNSLKGIDSKVLLLEFLGNVASTVSCGNGVKIKLRGISLTGLDLYGVRVDNIYCEGCFLFGAQYSGYQNMDGYCKKEGKSSGRKPLSQECQWEYKSYATVNYHRLRDK